MINNIKIKNTLLFLTQLILLFLFFVNSSSAFISPSEGPKKERIRQCFPSGDPKGNPLKEVNIEGISNVFYFKGDENFSGNDVDMKASNLYCGIYMGTFYTAVKVTQIAMYKACKVGPKPKFSPLEAFLIRDALRMTATIAKLAINKNDLKCKAAYQKAEIPWLVLLAHLATINKISKEVFKHTKVCGSDWFEYDHTTMTKNKPGEYQNEVLEFVENDANQEFFNIEDLNCKRCKKYREFYYGGVEKEYPFCTDPHPSRDKESNGQRYYFRGLQAPAYNCEQYNLARNRLPSSILEQFTTDELQRLKEDYKEAYECCQKTKRDHICVEYDSEQVTILGIKPVKLVNIPENREKAISGIENEPSWALCPALGSDSAIKGNGKPRSQLENLCVIDGIQFEAKYANSKKRMICAESFSLCPYNFNIGGGNQKCDPYRDPIPGETNFNNFEEGLKIGECNNLSEIRNTDCEINSFAGSCKNYCQPFEHCVMVEAENYGYKSTIESPYFSTACIDFIGNSQNKRGYGKLAVGDQKQRHFSAPIAQCVKETIENVFFNRAGHTKCLNHSIVYDPEQCFDNGALYVEGESKPLNKENFFNKIQNELRTIIQLVLIFSVIFTGWKIMSGNQDALKKKDLMKYIVKLAIVMYFVTGQAWQQVFFKGIYTASEGISSIVFQITVNDREEKRDGCQFGHIKGVDNSGIKTLAPGSNPYPKGKEYLAIWDSMDCKIARYLGMGLNADFSVLAQLIMVSMLIPGFGSMFAALLAIFGITMIVATIKMLHIFLMSAISIIILVYLSLIIIPLSLFKKTETIFKKWLENLISLSLQPLILFAYIGIFIAIFDNVLVGNAEFEGQAPIKQINCDSRCYNTDGSLKETYSKRKDEQKCDTIAGEVLITPKIDSIQCIIQLPKTSKFVPFQIIGVALPVLSDIISPKEGSKKRLAKKLHTLLRGALIIYILSAFINTIPTISQALIGGIRIPVANVSIQKAVMGVASNLKGITSRAGVGLQKKAKRDGAEGWNSAKNNFDKLKGKD